MAATAFLIKVVLLTIAFFTITTASFSVLTSVAYGFPDWWYPYDWYPYDYYDVSEYSPVYDYRYWYGLATAVQTELTARGYYHGQINEVIGSDSRQAIRAFQQAHGLPVTGLIDPSMLKALNLAKVPRVA